MINFKNWLEDATMTTSKPNSPSNIAVKTMTNKAFVNQTDKVAQLATAKSPEQTAKTAIGMATTAFKNPSNRKLLGDVTPIQAMQAIATGITGKPLPNMPNTSMAAMGKK